MRSYGKLESGFWDNPDVKSLSDYGKLLLTYLYSCKHGNMLGCFILPPEYIAADLKWTQEKVSERVSELVSNGYIELDKGTNLIRVIGWFGHNNIDNEKMAKGAVNTILTFPKCSVTDSLITELIHLSNKFLNKYIYELRNRYPYPFEETKQQPEPETKTKPIPETEPETGGYARDPLDSDRLRKSGSDKSFLEKNNHDAAAAACAALLGKRATRIDQLPLLDREHLTNWLMLYDFEDQLLPILETGLQKFMKKNPGKRPVSLAYFAEMVREKLG